MTRHVHPRLVTYVALAAAALFGAVALGRPDVVTLAVPFALALVVGLARARGGALDVDVRMARDRAVEGDDMPLEVELRSPVPLRADVDVGIPPGVSVVDGHPSIAVLLAPGESRRLDLVVRPDQWGVRRLGATTVRLTDGAGLFVYRARPVAPVLLRVHPRTERLRTLLRPARVQASTGSHPSRLRGDGIEFADIRPFTAGDRPRSVNWRASARRGELWINDRHPERHTDVVLFLDTFAAAGPAGDSTLDDAVRAAATLASRHLAVADRVGLIGLGGVIRWLQAGMGAGQLHAIIDSLLTTEVLFTWADKGVDLLPPRGIPPRALVVGLTPLLDRRGVTALLDLRARGYDVVVLECPVEGRVPTPSDELGGLARRLWAMEREGVRRQMRAMGVVVQTWQPSTSLEELIREVQQCRRSPRAVPR